MYGQSVPPKQEKKAAEGACSLVRHTTQGAFFFSVRGSYAVFTADTALEPPFAEPPFKDALQPFSKRKKVRLAIRMPSVMSTCVGARTRGWRGAQSWERVLDRGSANASRFHGTHPTFYTPSPQDDHTHTHAHGFSATAAVVPTGTRYFESP